MKLRKPGTDSGKYVAWARAAIGVVALASVLAGALEENAEQRPISVPLIAALFAFLAYALVLAVRRGGVRRGRFSLLALFTDTIYFMVLGNAGIGDSIWFSCLFYLFLLSEALALYGPREVLVVVSMCVLFCATAPDRPLGFLERTVLIAGSVASAFAIVKRRLERKAEELQQTLLQSREQAKVSLESERQRIANDFHDGPLQSFISLQMRLEIVRKLLQRDNAAGMQELEQLQDLARNQVREIRAFVRSMRPVEVDAASFFAAARRISDTFQKESGVPVTFVGGDTPMPLAQEAVTEVLNMLREALHNVQKHAGATRVAVTLEKNGDFLDLSVDDNGHGFHFSGSYTLEELEMLRLGPASLMRRARALNADLVLESRPGLGAGLKARIPVP